MKVINEIRDEKKQFNSIEEFDLFYQKHKDDMNSHTTQYLNKVYKINCSDGNEYRITKKNCVKHDGKIGGGDIYLKKVVNKKTEDNNINDLMYANIQADITNLQNTINELKQQIKAITESIAVIPDIKNTLNEVVKVVNEITHNI